MTFNRLVLPQYGRDEMAWYEQKDNFIYLDLPQWHICVNSCAIIVGY